MKCILSKKKRPIIDKNDLQCSRCYSRTEGNTALRGKQGHIEYLPLQTRSVVFTWVPSSMVCRVKSISGGGFLFLTARMALSKGCASGIDLDRPSSSMMMLCGGGGGGGRG